MRRRRKPRVVWLPPAAENRVNTANPAVLGISSGAGQLVIDGSLAFGDTATGFSPLVSDIDSASFQSGALSIASLSDINSSGYRLRRIVGKIYCDCDQPSVATGRLPQLMVTVGLIVLRTEPDGQPLSAATPGDYSPAIINNWADPWIWRRTWRLSVLSEAISLGMAAYPEANTQYGSVMDGPHVDAKTARVLGREERLFLVASVTAMSSPSGGGAAQFEVVVSWDLRFVASMRTSSGNRRNATR